MLALVALLSLLGGCGGSNSGGSAHINEQTGSTNGLPPDEREGLTPPPAEETDLEKAAEKADCYVYLTQAAQKGGEVPPNTPAPDYNVAVPNSGAYVEPPHQQADGAYLLTPDPIEYVAALNHGRLAIHYAPDLSEQMQLRLKGLFDTMYGGALLFPNEDMELAVAATAWRSILGCTTWGGRTTLDAIRAFGKETWGKRGNEPVDAFPVDGPTPSESEEPDAN